MTTNETTQKVVLITGASSGIGEATARLLAHKGLRVVLGARRTDRLEAIASEIRDKGGVAEYRALDVTSLEQMQAFVEFAKDKFGRIDVMVNNAGLMPLSKLEALKIDEWNRMIDVNIRGVLHGIAAALPIFKQQQSGQFVNLSSIGGHNVYPTAAVYCATKFAVWAISEGLRQESTDIRVTVISPGTTQSELASTITDAQAAQYFYSGKKQNHTLKNQFIVLPDGKDIVDIVPGLPGPKSDINLLRERFGQFAPKQKFGGDKAYQGEPQVMTPRKKPLGGRLTDEHKQQNREFSQQRIFVEHVIRLIKIFNVARERFRLTCVNYKPVILAICGLVRFRLKALILPS